MCTIYAHSHMTAYIYVHIHKYKTENKLKSYIRTPEMDLGGSLGPLMCPPLQCSNSDYISFFCFAYLLLRLARPVMLRVPSLSLTALGTVCDQTSPL